jgi:hypothetical protein
MALALDRDTGELQQEYSNWHERAVPAYNAKGEPNYLDDEGNIIEGIYLDMPNDVYHSLPALSSSKLKDFIKSPALYYRNYLSSVDRKRTQAQKNTFDAGTHGHTLVLEPQGYYQKFFRDMVQSDLPEAMTTAIEIEETLVCLGLPKSGNKQQKIERLIDFIEHKVPSLDPSNPQHAQQIEIARNVRIFEVERQRYLDSFGPAEEGVWEGEPVTTYGGKVPVDSIVWDDAHRVMKTTRDHEEANQYFQYGLPEVAIFAMCPLTGMMLKVKFDWLRFDDVAVDMKTTASVKPEKFRRQIEDLRYDIQQEFYKYVARLQDIPVEEFVFVATEYVQMDACQPFRLSEKRSKKAFSLMMSKLPELEECKKTNRWYGYVKQDCTMLLD